MAGQKERTKAKFPLDHEPEAFRFARERSGLTMTQLAERAGVSLSLVSEIESGTRNATPAMLLKFAEAMNCPLVVLERKRCPLPHPAPADDKAPAA
jgi:transcriptional regulator with XRE-family HTH domain